MTGMVRVWTKNAVILSIDCFTLLLSLFLAFYVRFEFDRSASINGFTSSYFISIILFTPIWLYSNIHRVTLRGGNIQDLYRIVSPVAAYSIVLFICSLFFSPRLIPFSVVVMHPAIFVVGVFLSRLLIFWTLDRLSPSGSAERAPLKRIILVGSFSALSHLPTVISREKGINLLAVFYTDGEAGRFTRTGVQTFGISALQGFISGHKVDEIWISFLRGDTEGRSSVLRDLAGRNISVRRIMPPSEWIDGASVQDNITDLDLSDILGREERVFNRDTYRSVINGKVVLITGAGGSIGAELTRQIFALRPKCLILLDHSEYQLYKIGSELRNNQSHGTGPGYYANSCDEVIHLKLGSITDRQFIDGIFASYAPEVIFHAAAYKHVSLVQKNASTGIFNNVYGTYVLCSAAKKHPVQKFILISSDKAVRPTNVMGKTKTISELILRAIGGADSNCLFAAVRFGNVLDSSGSVVPIFRRQIAKGGPVTVTHPEATRYFMTIPEAVDLVLVASSFANDGDVFVLDMGASVNILSLARRMISLAGLSDKISIEITGLRQGEKVHEELFISDSASKTACPMILKEELDPLSFDKLDSALHELFKNLDRLPFEELDLLLDRIIKEFGSTR